MFTLNRDVYNISGVSITADIKKNKLKFTSCLDINSSYRIFRSFSAAYSTKLKDEMSNKTGSVLHLLF